MTDAVTFATFFKERRFSIKKTLRQFCLENGFDPGNISKLERGLLAPPTDPEKLAPYAKALGIRKTGQEWTRFLDLAHAAAGKIPADLMSDRDLVGRLPTVFRTLRNKKVDRASLKELAEKIRRA